MSRTLFASIPGVKAAAESALLIAYIKRTKMLRIERGFTQQEMADALGIPLERYKKYETRSSLPPYLVPRFAAIVQQTADYILGGTKRRRGPRNPSNRPLQS